MKNLLIISTIILSFQFISAQEFKETDAYSISFGNYNSGEEKYDTTRAVSIMDAETTVTLTTFPVEAAETINNIRVLALPNPGLEDIAKVIKIETEYIDYCLYIVSQYILVTNDGDYIGLPNIGNSKCNDTTTEVRYIFPNQRFGTSDQIKRSEVTFSSSETISQSILLHTFIWNDDDFGNSGVIIKNF